MGPYCSVRLRDLSSHGCSVELVDRVQVHEVLWVKFPDIEARRGVVRWEKDYTCGIEFDAPFHPAVIDVIVIRMAS